MLVLNPQELITRADPRSQCCLSMHPIQVCRCWLVLTRFRFQCQYSLLIVFWLSMPAFCSSHGWTNKCLSVGYRSIQNTRGSYSIGILYGTTGHRGLIHREEHSYGAQVWH
uniref:Uncharacterized protein n=1 Tax=Picea glauca TaxID=3330 RepID=A0A101M206_PICGL|nr:hypothetical protein ABT39_MTgene2811 [Picea glauca]QHR87655.1 hypothetical protein Q903MT_gene1667 [Picea sitchensis]